MRRAETQSQDFSYSSSQYDTILFADLNAQDVSFARNDGGDLVISMTDGGSITVLDHFDNKQEDIERITFADGTTLDNVEIGAKMFSDARRMATTQSPAATWVRPSPAGWAMTR